MAARVLVRWRLILCGGSWSGGRSGDRRGSSDRWRLDINVVRHFGTG